jgi:hypothetical protein
MSACVKIENYWRSLVGKVGSIKKFYFTYQTKFVEIKKFVPLATYWLSGVGRSQLAIDR